MRASMRVGEDDCGIGCGREAWVFSHDRTASWQLSPHELSDRQGDAVAACPLRAGVTLGSGSRPSRGSRAARAGTEARKKVARKLLLLLLSFASNLVWGKRGAIEQEAARQQRQLRHPHPVATLPKRF